MSFKNYYEILGVRPTCTDAEIKSAYRDLARKYHPDHGGDIDRWDEINEAYKTLSDRVKRLALNVRLHAAPPPVRSRAAADATENATAENAAKVSAHPDKAVPHEASSRASSSREYVVMLEEQVSEYEKLLQSFARCTVSPARPELSPSSLGLLIRKNRSARERSRVRESRE